MILIIKFKSIQETISEKELQLEQDKITKEQEVAEAPTTQEQQVAELHQQRKNKK